MIKFFKNSSRITLEQDVIKDFEKKLSMLLPKAGLIITLTKYFWL